jgi:hypothetical protein
VERRKEQRVDSNESVRVTILDEQKNTLEGNLINLSGKGARISVPAIITPGTPIRVDTKDSILLGEVSHWRKHAGEIQIGLQIEHALTNLQQLARLRDSLLEESSPREPASPSVR